VNVFANRNSANNLFTNGSIILIFGNSNILKWVMIVRNHAHEWNDV